MASWTDKDLLEMNAKYAAEDVAFHVRPLRAAIEILGGSFSLDLLSNPEVSTIGEAFMRLIPEVDYTWPKLGIGLAASGDRVRLVRVPVMYGKVTIVPHEMIDFGDWQQWEAWCMHDPAIVAMSCFAVADMFDLACGYSDLRGKSQIAENYWTLTLSNLETVAKTLSNNFLVPAVTQNVCMTAELSLKAALLFLGVEEKTLASRKFGHNVDRLAELLAEKVPHRDDLLVGEIVQRLPKYVDSRYSVTHRTRLELIKLGLGVQFVAASSMRRLTDRDLALQMEENDGWPSARKNYFDS